MTLRQGKKLFEKNCILITLYFMYYLLTPNKINKNDIITIKPTSKILLPNSNICKYTYFVNCSYAKLDNLT